MNRIAVVGSSGAGKTTMARELAARLGLTHIELDQFQHLPGWTQAEPDDFVAGVTTAMAEATDGWVMCGSYDGLIGQQRTAAADTVVWLDYSRMRIQRRLIARTIRRAITREELWNGNREPLSNFYRWEPGKNVIRWSWVHFAKRRQQYAAYLSDGSWDHCTVHRFRDPSDADQWLATL